MADKVDNAKNTYASKICDDYLDIDEDGCKEAFDTLIDNMKAGYEALE